MKETSAVVSDADAAMNKLTTVRGDITSAREERPPK